MVYRIARWLRRAGLVGCLLAHGLELAWAADWREDLQARIEVLDRASPGTLGLYVKNLATGDVFSYGADKGWYLSSTAKVPIAVAVLQQVDAGRLRLADTAVLQETDKVDGSGELVWARPGTRYSIDALLTRMLGVSDNTAANMLVRSVGIQAVNQSAAAAMGERGVGPLTDFTQVRRDVYTQLHPKAGDLSNRQLVEVAGAPQGPGRVRAVQRALGVEASALDAKTIDDAYARYYQKGLNTATLQAYGGMLEQLVRGRLLSPQSTQRLFKAMKFDTRGTYRLEAGVPPQLRFIHKTGTQYRRACHMGVISPENGGAKAVVVAACAADLDDVKEAGPLLLQVGRAITAAMQP